MKKNFLEFFPSPEEMLKTTGSIRQTVNVNPNGHIHTPFSFSAFKDIQSVFELASAEGVNVLGINDFYVADGYEPFHDGAVASGVFPLFNIEFIGLMKEEQKSGIRINDPNNPGRIYFCGKGLDYPFRISESNRSRLSSVKEETQRQLKAMLGKLNGLIAAGRPDLSLSFEVIKQKYARELVRERHIARALRELAEENFNPPNERTVFLESLYGGKKSKASLYDPAALENEIRSNILKAGGTAFVEEDESSFLAVEDVIAIILDAGGIPCYPVLLDDPAGKYTEFEGDFDRLHTSLGRLGVGCIELIPGRNDFDILERFVRFFDEKGFVIIFGTEHNTPEMIPLTVTARGKRELSPFLKQTALNGVSIIAAHQYLRAKGEKGFTGDDGKSRQEKKAYFQKLGTAVVEYFLSNR